MNDINKRKIKRLLDGVMISIEVIMAAIMIFLVVCGIYEVLCGYYEYACIFFGLGSIYLFCFFIFSNKILGRKEVKKKNERK